MVGCEKSYDAVIDTKIEVPFLISGSLLPNIINTDSINVGPERKPNDTLKLSATLRIQPSVLPSLPPNALFKYTLSNPDRSKTLTKGSIAGTDLTVKIEFEILRSEIGVFQCDIWGENVDGLRGNMIRLPLTIARLNQAPILNGVIAPDSVRLGNQNQYILLQLRVTDPDGLTDIQRVFFNSFKPDGTASSGNPFTMYDDGGTIVVIPPDIKSGDLTKGDGIYSLTVVLPPSTAIGTYRFEFQAVDRSNSYSNILIHHLIVRP